MNLKMLFRTRYSESDLRDYQFALLKKLQMPKVLVQTLANWCASPLLAWLIIGFGVLVRITAYIHNPSLWVDEAALASNIVNKSLAELMGILDFNTAAPAGFLLLEKLAVTFLGNNEQSLRLFPLIAGIGSLFLMYAVAKQYLSTWAIPIALILFATSTSLVRYSYQVKQYSGDVFFTLLVLLIADRVFRKEYEVKWLLIFAFGGATAIWFSYPVAFVLAGLGAVMIWRILRAGKWSKTVQLGLVGVTWLASFSVFFFGSSTQEVVLLEGGLVDHLSETTRMVPIIPRSLGDIRWFLDTPLSLFDVPAGISLTGLAMFSLILGVISLWRDSPPRVFFLISPLVVTALVSGAKLYPFTDRFVLFLVPMVLLLVAQGAIFLLDNTKRLSPAIGVTLIFLLLLFPITSELYRLIEPRGTEEVRPVLQYIQTQKLEGDELYVYPGAFKAFEYYADRFQIEESEYVIGAPGTVDGTRDNDPNAFLEDIRQLEGKNRVWFLFSNVKNQQLTGGWINEEAFIVFHLDSVGKRMDEFRIHNAVAYLYDLTPRDQP